MRSLLPCLTPPETMVVGDAEDPPFMNAQSPRLCLFLPSPPDPTDTVNERVICRGSRVHFIRIDASCSARRHRRLAGGPRRRARRRDRARQQRARRVVARGRAAMARRSMREGRERSPRLGRSLSERARRETLRANRKAHSWLAVGLGLGSWHIPRVGQSGGVESIMVERGASVVSQAVPVRLVCCTDV